MTVYLLVAFILLTACGGVTQTETGEARSTYFQAYRDFLLYTDIDQGSDFPVWGYYLLDMHYDGVPELGILHD